MINTENINQSSTMSKKDYFYIVAISLIVLFCVYIHLLVSFVASEHDREIRELKQSIETQGISKQLQILKLEERVEQTEKSIENLADRVYSED